MDEQVEPVRHSLAACGELYGWIRQYQDIHVGLKDDVNPASCLLMQIGHRLLFVLSGSLEFIDVAAGRSTKVAQAALLGASTRPAFSLRSTGQL